MCDCLPICALHSCSTFRDQNRGNESSRTELLAAVNYHIGAGTETESSTGAASDLTTEPSCQRQVSFN